MRHARSAAPRAATRARLLSPLLALVAACAVEPVAFELPASHPASSEADEAPLPTLSTTLALPAPADGSATPAPDSVAPADARASWVCPMHADVVSDEPGRCPKCGMPLKLHRPAPQPEGDAR